MVSVPWFTLRSILVGERERAAAEDQAIAETEAELPYVLFDVDSDSDSDSEDVEYFPPVARSHDAEAGANAATDGSPGRDAGEASGGYALSAGAANSAHAVIPVAVAGHVCSCSDRQGEQWSDVLNPFLAYRSLVANYTSSTSSSPGSSPSFEDSPQPIVLAQHPSVEPSSVVQLAFDELDATLQQMASQGVDTSSSNPCPDIVSTEVPAPSASVQPLAGSLSPVVDTTVKLVSSNSKSDDS
ncbi:uncharacterized protein LOC133884057 [Phragmites australis]|uniref:uncharacterized protein LOC133884057 n=1 Tax=Phragmites australis TaxID=29695 RepID=UPI002D78AC6B|nr:uncharacterized protein LOC133884057 [Phragmites australis]